MNTPSWINIKESTFKNIKTNYYETNRMQPLFFGYLFGYLRKTKNKERNERNSSFYII